MCIQSNGVALDMEMATKNHLTLNFYTLYYEYIQGVHHQLSKEEVYDIKKGSMISYSGNNQTILQFYKLLGDQVPTH